MLCCRGFALHKFTWHGCQTNDHKSQSLQAHLLVKPACSYPALHVPFEAADMHHPGATISSLKDTSATLFKVFQAWS